MTKAPNWTKAQSFVLFALAQKAPNTIETRLLVEGYYITAPSKKGGHYLFVFKKMGVHAPYSTKPVILYPLNPIRYSGPNLGI